jgi:cytochrome P450
MREIDEVIKVEEDYNEDNLKRLVYTTAVLNETHRIYGPGTNILTRICCATHTLKGIPIEVGTVLNTEFAPNNFNPEIYKDPHEFIP